MVLWLPAQWLAVGICLFAGVHVLQSGTVRHQPVYAVFGSLSLFVALYIALTAMLQMPAQPLATVGLIERMRLAVACVIYPAAFVFIALFTRMRHWRKWSYVVAAWFLALLAVNLDRPWGLLRDSMRIDPILWLPWGEPVAQFSGTVSYWAWPFFASALVVLAWSLWRCSVLWRMHERARAGALWTYVAVQLLVVAYGQVATVLAWRGPDFTAMPFLVLVILVSRVLTREWRQRGEDLAASLDALAVESSVREQAQDSLRKMAYRDSVTGLPNRNRLLEQIAAMQSQPDQVRKAALLVVGLDGFHSVNDALGHEAGDQLLRAFADRLVDLCRHATCVARLEGGDFGVLIGVSQEAHARDPDALGHQLTESMTRPLRFDAHALTLGVSIGIVHISGPGSEAPLLLQQAALALRHARNRSRGSRSIFEPRMQSEASRQITLIRALHEALNSGQLRLLYQPQIDGRGRLVGAEALMRWHHPEFGEIAPDEFIPLAERSGLIHVLGRYALVQSCVALRSWPEGAPRVRLSVNVSAWQLRRADFTDMVAEVIQTYSVAPGMLMLELTESALIDDATIMGSKVRLLRSLGIGVSIDDFGTGYASLASLKSLPVEEVKIDRSFVQDMSVSEPDRFIGAIIELARALDVYVVAEGVETRAQRDALARIGCDAFQGHGIARPMELAQLLAMAVASAG